MRRTEGRVPAVTSAPEGPRVNSEVLALPLLPSTLPSMDSLSDLLSRLEGKTLEFKRDLSSPDGLIKTIVAFANGAGGTILVGVEDRTRAVRGLPEPLKEVERLTNLVSDRIEPGLAPDLQVVPWRKTHVVAAHVFPSPSRPHYVKQAGAGCRDIRPDRRLDPPCRSRPDRRVAAVLPRRHLRRGGAARVRHGSDRLPSCFRVLRPGPSAPAGGPEDARTDGPAPGA